MPKYTKFKIAFDAKKSMRKFDDNGYLHVALTPISKACVNPYYGWEIPDGDKWDLRPNEIYFGLRDPDELKNGAMTFNGLPLLMDHHSISAEEQPKEYICGATGTDAVFDGTYLKNSLAVHDADAIRAIEDGSAKELSCAYRFEPEFTAGEFDVDGEKVHYDFIMRKIRGNHVALVAEGRAGHDVAVADGMPKNIRKEKEGMRKRKVANDSIDKLISEFAPELDEARRAAFKAGLKFIAQNETEPMNVEVLEEEPEKATIPDAEVIEAAAEEADAEKAAAEKEPVEETEEAEVVEETKEEAPEEAPAPVEEELAPVEEKPAAEETEEDAEPEDDVNAKVDKVLESGEEDPKKAVAKLMELLKLDEEPAKEEAKDADEVAEVAEEEEVEPEEKPEAEPEPEAEDDLEKLLEDPKFKAGFDLGLAVRQAYEKTKKKGEKEVVEESAEEAPDAEPEPEAEDAEEVVEEVTEEEPAKEKPVVEEEAAEVFGQDTAARLKQWASENAKQQCREIVRAAEKVRPLIGAVVDPLAFDSAEDIYRLAIERSGRDASKYDRKSYQAVVDVLVDSKPAYAKVARKSETPEDVRDHFRFLKNISR